MKTVHAIGEFKLIDRIRRRLHRPTSVVAGIGDDAAVARTKHGELLLFASDMLVEGTHFRRDALSPAAIGWKALACNISDIAAMGGAPLWAVVSLGLPPRTPIAFVDGLYAGLERCARRNRCAVVGGDTVRAPQVIVDVAIIGYAASSQVVRRSGARIGDTLCVTGRLGGSYLSGHHAAFTPRVAEAQALLKRARIHAMMDLSDGLASDLWQMSRASGAILRIEAKQVPISRAGKTLRHALMDGEDFELLFAVAARDVARLPRRMGSCPVTSIGRVVRRGVGVELQRRDGRIVPLIPTGFRHF
ncbi:MAG: thiamine-phosphate kinase [Candidatus Omnitrophica bacterium]|nr:thiamine-phosphate kinase [Candidatus Omnitrophota bacterium]